MLGLSKLSLGIFKIDARGYQIAIRELPLGILMIVGTDCQNFGIVKFEYESILL